MIFVTVGTYVSFDRLVKAVDEWAGRCGRSDVFAQIGSDGWRPKHIKWTEFLDPKEFARKVEEADIIIAHAGMGSIITALDSNKPILVMPRRLDLHEMPGKSDHQVCTARRLMESGYITAAFDEGELASKLDQLEIISSERNIASNTLPQLLDTIKDFINDETA